MSMLTMLENLTKDIRDKKPDKYTLNESKIKHLQEKAIEESFTLEEAISILELKNLRVIDTELDHYVPLVEKYGFAPVVQGLISLYEHSNSESIYNYCSELLYDLSQKFKNEDKAAARKYLAEKYRVEDEEKQDAFFAYLPQVLSSEVSIFEELIEENMAILSPSFICESRPKRDPNNPVKERKLDHQAIASKHRDRYEKKYHNVVDSDVPPPGYFNGSLEFGKIGTKPWSRSKYTQRFYEQPNSHWTTLAKNIGYQKVINKLHNLWILYRHNTKHLDHGDYNDEPLNKAIDDKLKAVQKLLRNEFSLAYARKYHEPNEGTAALSSDAAYRVIHNLPLKGPVHKNHGSTSTKFAVDHDKVHKARQADRVAHVDNKAKGIKDELELQRQAKAAKAKDLADRKALDAKNSAEKSKAYKDRVAASKIKNAEEDKVKKAKAIGKDKAGKVKSAERHIDIAQTPDQVNAALKRKADAKKITGGIEPKKPGRKKA